jgi:hypothetical protein
LDKEELNMSRNGKKVDYEYGYSGEIIVLVDGRRYCTVDNWQEFRKAKDEILGHNIYGML